MGSLDRPGLERPILERPQAVLFDWDKTLASNWGAVEYALNTALVSQGHDPWTEEEIHLRVRASARDTFPKLFGRNWEEAFQVFRQAFVSRQFIDLAALEGALSLLEHFEAREIPVAVVSNKLGAALRAEVAHLGWERFFVALVGAEDAARDKPDPAPVHMALAPTAVAPGPHVWFVGDSSIDMHCAHNAGLTAVLSRPNIPEADPEFKKYPAHLHVTDCRNLLDVLYEYEI
ncbi:MAG: HAD family hydrolase [Alphaproteobacteria bacterium]|nr:HAD family hydrolase [Alphaproteobacteria bacterium]